MSNNNASDGNVTCTMNCKANIEHFSADKSLDMKMKDTQLLYLISVSHSQVYFDLNGINELSNHGRKLIKM